MEKLECGFLQQNFLEAEELLQTLLVKSKNTLDRAQIRIIQIQDPYLDNATALEIGKKTLKELGISLPKKIKQHHIITEMIKSKLKFAQ